MQIHHCGFNKVKTVFLKPRVIIILLIFAISFSVKGNNLRDCSFKLVSELSSTCSLFDDSPLVTTLPLHTLKSDSITSFIENNDSQFKIIILGLILVALFIAVLVIMQRRYESLYYRSRRIAIKAKNLKAKAHLFNVSLDSFNAFTWIYDFRTETIYFESIKLLPVEATQIDNFDKVISFLHPDDVVQFKMKLNDLLEDRTETINCVYRIDYLHANKYQWWEVRAVKEIRYDDNGRRYDSISGINININDHKVAETQLSIAVRKAEESDRFKREFLSALSHELRIPIGLVLDFSKAMETAENKLERQRYCEIVKNNGEVLLNLANDINEISQMESGIFKFSYTHFDIAKVFKDAILSLKSIIPTGVELKLNSPYSTCIIDYDLSRIMQVIGNFVTYSAYNTDRGTITMSYKCIDNGIRIEVTDTSDGISAMEKEKLFSTIESRTGLGLCINKIIIEYSAGQIGVDSEQGKGTTLWAWIPCNPLVDSTNSIQEDIPSYIPVANELKLTTLKTLSVLVADDVKANYRLVQACLRWHNVEHAINGAVALQMASIKRYDIIIMDIKMPILNGIETVKKIREFDSATPIIALSAHAFAEDKSAALKAGCNDFISKPFVRETLISKINQLLPQK